MQCLMGKSFYNVMLEDFFLAIQDMYIILGLLFYMVVHFILLRKD